MPSFPSPNPPKNRYHMLAKHSPACLTTLGHSFVSESYKASSGMTLERTTLPPPPIQTWELKKAIYLQKTRIATCSSPLGVSVLLFLFICNIYSPLPFIFLCFCSNIYGSTINFCCPFLSQQWILSI
jgi:hypothetical protein